MNLKETIQTLFREIEVYQSHSLFEEAMEKCRRLAKLIEQNDRIKNRQELLGIVAKKIQALKKESRKLEDAAATAQMTSKEQELVKKLFAFSEEPDEDSALWEGATALLIFGQFKKALSEFQKLIGKDSLRVDAAKNILRCHIGLSSLDEAISQYQQWLSSGRFQAREMQSIRSLLQDILEKKGIHQTLSKPVDSKAADEEKTEEETFIDIMSIQLPSQFRQIVGRDVVLDVSYQRGHLISMIIPKKDQTLVDKFKNGLKIDDVQLFSPAVVFRSACLVSAVNQIMTGPQKEGYALVMQVLNE